MLIIFLFSEEFARAWASLRTSLRRFPRRWIIVYPLLLLLLGAAGFIIIFTLIQFSTSLTFSYD